MKKQTYRYTTLVLFFMLACLKSQLFSSPQGPDYLIYKGDTIAIYNLILEQHLNEIKADSSESLFGLNFRNNATFNCWRGYQAIYQISNDSLYLIAMVGCGELDDNKTYDKKTSEKRLDHYFPTSNNSDKIHCKWYSGNISLKNGNILRWDGVFSRIYEEEILIKIRKGKKVNVKHIENYAKQVNAISRRFNDTISNVIFERLSQLNWQKLDQIDCSENYFFNINKKGKIDLVGMANYTKEELNQYFEKRELKNCLRNVHKAVRDLKFDIIKYEGKPITEKITLEVWYEESTGELENISKF